MRTVDFAYNQPPNQPNQAYSASVPLSVYRELAAELQAAQVAIHQLNQQNEHLAQENQVLRQKIAKTVNAVLHLQNAVNSPPDNVYNGAAYSSFNQPSVEKHEKQYTPQNKQYKRQNSPTKKRVKRSRTSPVIPQVTEYIEPMPETVFIEEEQASYFYNDESELSQVSGWWLIFAIIFIIIMGFGAGYIVVRPLLENHTR